MIKELDDSETALKPGKYPRVIRSPDNIDYALTFVSNEAFETMLYTGFFTEFHPEAQKKLSDIYITIKRRNDFLMHTYVYEDMFFLYDESEKRLKKWLTAVKRYEIMITNYEKELLGRFDDARQTVSKEMEERS